MTYYSSSVISGGLSVEVLSGLVLHMDVMDAHSVDIYRFSLQRLSLLLLYSWSNSPLVTFVSALVTIDMILSFLCQLQVPLALTDNRRLHYYYYYYYTNMWYFSRAYVIGIQIRYSAVAPLGSYCIVHMCA